jgi:histidinol-phosphate aminotransferase
MRYKEYLENNLKRPILEKSDREQYICLDKNEPPFSAFDIVDNLLSDNDIQSLRVYPDPYELYQKLANYLKVDINNILITQGSEQALEFCFRIFLDEGDEVVYLSPSFAMFDVFAISQKAKIHTIDFNDDISLELNKVLDNITDNTRLFVLANPNNPTGTAFNLEELDKIAQHTKEKDTVFVLDEAYFHFYNIDSIQLIKKYEHIIITRTFSKALGVAGARVGYAISSENNIKLLRKIKPIDEINQLSNVIAKKVLDNIDIILEKNCTQVLKWKKIFKERDINNIEYIETEGNFVLLKSSSYEIHKKALLQNKILPKYDFQYKYLSNCFRFSILDDSTMEKVINILDFANQLDGWDDDSTVKYYTTNRTFFDDLYDSEKHFINKGFLSTVSTVLDVGSSVGGMSNVFRELNSHIRYTDIDVSQKSITKAKQIYGNATTEFYWYNGVDDFPLSDNKYELVFCSGVMHLIDNYKYILNQMISKADRYLIVDFRVTTKDTYIGKFYFDFSHTNNDTKSTNYYVLNFIELIDLFSSYTQINKINIYGYKGTPSNMSQNINEVYMLFFKLEIGEDSNNIDIIFDSEELEKTFGAQLYNKRDI